MKFPMLLAVMAIALSACSGGGGDGSQEPTPRSGSVDATYGQSGRVEFAPVEQMSAAVVDAAGNAYVTGASVVKVDRSGARVAGYGGPASPPEVAAFVDTAGALFTVTTAEIVKRDAAGQPAMSFGSGGRVQVAPWSTSADELQTVYRDPAGNLLAVGTVPGFIVHAVSYLALAKVDPAGHLVDGFGSAGRKVTSHFSSTEVVSTLDPQGNLEISVTGAIGGAYVRKLTSNGDPVGGADWVALEGCNYLSRRSLATTPAGDTFVGIACAPDDTATVFKIDSNGAPVQSFGTAGRASGFFPLHGKIGALLAAPDGSLYVAGSILRTTPGLPACSTVAVAKLDPAGRPVASFGTNGLAVPDPSAGTDDHSKMMALDANGMLYVGVAGGSQCPVDYQPNAYSIFRLYP